MKTRQTVAYQMIHEKKTLLVILSWSLVLVYFCGFQHAFKLSVQQQLIKNQTHLVRAPLSIGGAFPLPTITGLPSLGIPFETTYSQPGPGG